MKIRKYFGIVPLLLLLAACEKEPEPPAEEPGVKVAGDLITFPSNSPQISSLISTEVKPNDAAVSSMTGRLTWDDQTTVHIYTPLSGRVSQILVDIGDIVSQGETLVRIASPDFGQIEADAVRATADLTLSEKTLARTKDLLNHGAAAEKDVEAAEDDLSVKRSESQRAQAKLAQFGGRVGEVSELFDLKAPIAGTLVEKSISSGQELVADGATSLFVISDPTKLWLSLDVTETDLSKVKVGQDVIIHSRTYPDRVFSGKVQMLGLSLDPATRTIKSRVLVDNSEKLLRAEMYVTAELKDVASGGWVVPLKATFHKDDKDYLFIELSPGQYQRQLVKLGAQNQDQAVVLDGLSSGQRIVSQGGIELESILESGGKE